MSPTTVELIGYLASGLIVVSLLMSSVLRLRLVNLAGALVFTGYGLLIGSLPVVAANAAIVGINLWHLRRLLNARVSNDYFEVLEVGVDSPVLHRFLAFYRDDIRHFQPDAPDPQPDHRALLILRDAVPAGVVLARRTAPGTVRIDLDYVIEVHRDLRPGTHLYDESGVFHEDRLEATAPNPAHRRYLRRLGFAPRDGLWVRESLSAAGQPAR